MLADYLRTHTRQIHEQTEEVFALFDKPSGNFNISNYPMFLLSNYLWYEEIEKHLIAGITPDRYVYEPRRYLLEKDVGPAQLTGLKPVFDRLSDVHPLGVLYVADGSLMGGHVMYKYITAGGNDPGLPMNYLRFCYDSGPAVWKQTRKNLNRYAVEGEELTAILKSAREAFKLIFDIASRLPKDLRIKMP